MSRREGGGTVLGETACIGPAERETLGALLYRVHQKSAAVDEPLEIDPLDREVEPAVCRS